MKGIVEYINRNSDWLYVKICENHLFFFDYWTFVHIWSGFIIFAFLHLLSVKNKWAILFSILIFYELFEITTLYFALDVFRPESIKDQFTDIIVGIFGGFLFSKYSLIYSNGTEKKKRLLLSNNLFIAVFTAATLSFMWVGFYKYEYNLSFFNSAGLNYAAFLLWFFASVSLIITYLKLNNYFNKTVSIFLLYALYISVLFSIESVSYHLLGWKEIGSYTRQPLIFNIIHGTTVLHVFYLIQPFLLITLFTLFRTFLIAALEKNPQYFKELELIAESADFTE